MDLFQKWSDLTIPTNNPDDPRPGDSSAADNPIPAVFMPIAVCPSNHPKKTVPAECWLAYGVNTGQNRPNTFAPDKPDLKIPAQGVCNDLFPDPGKEENIIRVGVSYMSSHDGNSTTILIGEKSSSKHPLSRWAPLDTPPKGKWSDAAGINAEALGVNWIGFDAANPAASKATMTDKLNSNHPRGSVVTFCDSHTTFLRDDIDPVVFMQLMAPNDHGVLDDDVGIRNPKNTKEPAPPLDESKF